MDFFTSIFVLGVLGAGVQSADLSAHENCTVTPIPAAEFNESGGLVGYISRNSKNEWLAGTWDQLREEFTPAQAINWGAVFERDLAKPIAKFDENDAKKLIQKYGYFLAIPTWATKFRTTLYTESIWPAAPGYWGGFYGGLHVTDEPSDRERGVVARYSLAGDEGGQVRVKRCAIPADSYVSPDHIARIVGPGEPIPAWVKTAFKADPRPSISGIDLEGNERRKPMR